jgi:hypothetical protein
MDPPRSGHGFTLAVFAVAAALAVAVFVALSKDEPPGAGPTPTPGVFPAPLELALVPPGSDELQRQITSDIGAVLAELYERAFVPQAATETTPAPTGEITPASRIRSLFTKKAAAALREDPDVFERATDLTIARGRVTFGGLATLEGDKPVQALLEVVFDATATPEERVSPLVRVRQRGTILMVYRSNRWFVDGFDLRFASAPVTPSPSPSPDR